MIIPSSVEKVQSLCDSLHGTLDSQCSLCPPMMNLSVLRPSSVARLASTETVCRSCLSIIFGRHQSSYRRTRKRLNVKPDPSFLSSNESPLQDHIIFNPPPSAPSLYHTPLKFLPRDDPRRTLFVSTNDAAADVSTPTRLPPLAQKPHQKSYHLTEKEITQIRQLREKDPDKWSRLKLAAKFKCSPLFVGIICQVSKERQEQLAQKLEAIKAKWGQKRRMAREDRAKRREMWGREE